jgi:hypothetical protein
MSNLPARVQDVNPFAAIVAIGIALIGAIVIIVRRTHK